MGAAGRAITARLPTELALLDTDRTTIARPADVFTWSASLQRLTVKITRFLYFPESGLLRSWPQEILHLTWVKKGNGISSACVLNQHLMSLSTATHPGAC